MAKSISPQNFLTGGIKVSKAYIYEFCIYKIYKNRAELYSHRYFKSDKYLGKEVVKYRRTDKCVVEKSFTLIGAPKSFINYENRKN